MLLTWQGGRLPAWAFPAACYAATALITLGVYFSDDVDTPYALYYVLVAMFAAYFLSVRHLLLLTLFVAVAYPAIIGLLGGGDESGQRWLVTTWTVLVVGAFIAILRQRMNNLIARLSDAARTDPLTQLLNRRGFHDVFDLELERSRRSGRPCALLMADLDHFKRVNDVLGHPAGDARLRKFARLLEAGKRRIDASARIARRSLAPIICAVTSGR